MRLPVVHLPQEKVPESPVSWKRWIARCFCVFGLLIGCALSTFSVADQHRPEILAEIQSEIQNQIPSKIQSEIQNPVQTEIPDKIPNKFQGEIPEHIAPPSLLLAETAPQDLATITVSAYWLSEKYDGVRAYWNGQALYTRTGKRIHAPTWFTAALPATELDGELWLARGRFAETAGIVNTQLPQDEAWRKIAYMIFELPHGEGDFSSRAAQIKIIVAQLNVPWLQAVRQYRLPADLTLQDELDQMVKAGGEGLMLHRADALYVSGRNPALLKVKAWQDMEGTVVGHIAGKGRLEGLMGAVALQLADGKMMRLGSGFTDEQRRSPPPIGSVLTFRYRGLTAKGLPRFASYWRKLPEPQ